MLRSPGRLGLLVLIVPLSACGLAGAGTAPTPTLVHTRQGAFDPRHDAGPTLAGVDPVVVGAERPWIVQLDGPVTAVAREALHRAGATLTGFYPPRALLVRASPAVATALAGLAGVRAVVPQSPALRLASALVDRRHGLLAPSTRLQPEALLVSVADPDAVQAVAQAARSLGGTTIRTTRAAGLLRVSLAPALAAELAARTDVTFVEPAPNLHYLNNEARWVIQAGAGTANVDKTPVWDHGLTGQGEIVGIADSGINTDSCFFADVPNKIFKYAVLPGAKKGDEIGHGTHTSGSIAGNETTDPKLAKFDGQAKDAQLYFQDVGADDSGSLTAVPDDLGSLFQPPYDAGVRIHSDSWGGVTSSYDAFARSIDTFVHAHPDFLVLFANGNAGPNRGSVGSPATAKDLISVGATENAIPGAPNRPNGLAYFSSEGPTADGRIKPTLTAPGDRITSASSRAACDVVAEQGTSMATPTLAGGAALVRQYFTDGFYPSGTKQAADAMSPSAALLRAVLIAGASHMTGPYAGRVPSSSQGFGRVDLGRSLYFAGDQARTRLYVDDVTPGIGTGDAPTITLKTDRAGPLRVALAWSDAPGTLGAQIALVNDLDLEVTAPDGTVYRGNALRGGESIPGGGADHLDVEELVSLDRAPAGTFTVTVRGTDVPAGPQAYALTAVGEVVVPGQGAPSDDTVAPPAPDPNPHPPACTDATVIPDKTTVAWAAQDDPALIHVGDDDLYAGSLPLVTGDAALPREAVFQVPVDVPAGETLDHLSVTLTGQDDASLKPFSTFTLEAVDLSPISRTMRFADLDGAPVLAVGEQVLDDTQVGRYLENVVTFPASAVKNGVLTVRLRGAGPSGSAMSWDSGVVKLSSTGSPSTDLTPGLRDPPVVGLCLGQGPAAARTPLTLAPLPATRVEVGQTLKFTVKVGSDPKVASPVLLAAGLPDGAHFDAATGAFSWTPVEADEGHHPVRFSTFEGDRSAKIAADLLVVAAVAPKSTKKTNGCGCSATTGDPEDLWFPGILAGVFLLGWRRRRRS